VSGCVVNVIKKVLHAPDSGTCTGTGSHRPAAQGTAGAHLKIAIDDFRKQLHDVHVRIRSCHTLL
jgi:hypothetical protein